MSSKWPETETSPLKETLAAAAKEPPWQAEEGCGKGSTERQGGIAPSTAAGAVQLPQAKDWRSTMNPKSRFSNTVLRKAMCSSFVSVPPLAPVISGRAWRRVAGQYVGNGN